MLNYINSKNYLNIEKTNAFLRKNHSFTLTGLTAFLRLFLLAEISLTKKVIFITNTEQNALKYKHDLEKLFDITSKIFPYQDVSPYDGVSGNLYKYSQQISILKNLLNENLLLVPVKALTEKFPAVDFYEKNSFNIKVDSEINLSDLPSKLVSMGYKRVTMVSDIGEFSVRGDIIDIYTHTKNGKPVRIELWGDTVVDIRYFNNETQRSIKKRKDR